mmetsp:Transcript_16811/g.36577  ORF Transcript_16811/g.36577 Transcript_16811/m.36577 type:complete len:578 (-) Transcript_16811:129-1862(-)
MTITSSFRPNVIRIKSGRRNLGSCQQRMSCIIRQYHCLFLIVVLGLFDAVSCEQVQSHSLRGFRPVTTARNVLADASKIEAIPSRERKSDIFVALRLSNDFDDDVIALYGSSNDAPPPEYLVSTPTVAPSDHASGEASTAYDHFDRAPSRPADVNVSNFSASPSPAPTASPSELPSAMPMPPPSVAPTASIIPSTSPNNFNLIIPRYHQEERNSSTITEVDTSVDQLQSTNLNASATNKNAHLVPALLTGFASTVLFCALFLVCANQRERYVQRKFQREQIRRAALTDDESSAKSIDRAYSDPFDVYGEEEERRSTRSISSAEFGSSGGGSYWVQAVMKELSENSKGRGKQRATTPSSLAAPTNILPPLQDQEEVDDASIGLYSYVSSLTQSMMTMGSGHLPRDEIALNIDPSKERVAEGNASSRAHSPAPSDEDDNSLRPSGSNEETNSSVCSSLTDGTNITLKSNEFDESTLPVIGEKEEDEGVQGEEHHHISIFSSSRRSVGMAKDVSSDSTHTPSTVLDDASLDLASEMERLQTLITSIKPGDDDIYTDVGVIPRSLSGESLDFGVTEGREEI